MKKKILVVNIFFLTALMVSCLSYSKDNYLKDFTFIKAKVETDYKSYTSGNSSRKNSEFQQFAEKLRVKHYTIKRKCETIDIINKVRES